MGNCLQRIRTVRNTTVLLIGLATIAIGCARRESMVVQVWRTAPVDGRESRVFPERDDEDYRLERVQPKTVIDDEGDVVQRTIGVCFSGGGLRSASATLGQLRAMEVSGFIDDVAYMSCVSGGSWAAVPYTFTDEIDTEAFLGSTQPFDLIDADDFISRPNGRLAEKLSETPLPYWPCLALRVAGGWIGLADTDWYRKTLFNLILNGLDAGKFNQPITQNERSLRELRDKQKDANLFRGTFKVDLEEVDMPAKNRPFLIVQGTLRRYDTWPGSSDKHHNKRMPIEMTPLYTGVPARFRDVGKSGRFVGGAYVETIGYGAARARPIGDDRLMVEMKRYGIGLRKTHRFGVADMMAVSGAAPAEYEFFARPAFPHYPHWAPDNPRDERPETYVHGDGGFSDTLGMMSLLARRVTHIVAFVNAEADGVPDYVRAFFGDPRGEFDGWRSRAVFPPHRLSELEEAILPHRGNRLPLHIATYPVTRDLANGSEDPFHLHLRPDEGYQVTVAWLFLDARRWKEIFLQQNPKAAVSILDHHEMNRFPKFKTFLNRSFSLVDPTPRQVNALSHLTAWTFTEAAPQIRESFMMAAPSQDSER